MDKETLKDTMKLSIITINRNNAHGLEKTMSSVLSQTATTYEYIIIDGASTDLSTEIIKRLEHQFSGRLKWISELDSGIYNAMNKGIKMASGDYIQILNSGDVLAESTVTERMIKALEEANYPSILYGNMNKQYPDGTVLKDKCYGQHNWTMYDFIRGTINHNPTYISKELYEKYGLYDESLKIVSDWKWFVNAVVFGEEKPVYVPIDVTIFDMTGISETNLELREAERLQELREMLPNRILVDYLENYFNIIQMRRLHRHKWAYRLVWFIERSLFKIEKLSR